MSGLRKNLAGVVLAFAVVALAGCAGSNDASGGSTIDPVGTWGDPSGEYLSLADDGSLSGSDGCNRITGTWKVEADQVQFGSMASTKMACEGVDDWLSEADAASISDSTMTVLGAGGAQIGSLEKSSDDPE
ncbi:META domain-containing protein [Agromyces aerolatus]|uniref:META domain-containing protein n=1 Tax=Agromyces sp. LY-1074 TaxID=3074080 RepID=UPI002860791D|nr:MULTISPECIES: META domain-containing protein [unclassified Agromyces]MDR5698205.1 META domain-containing protein [Agromyces sp. LY-1074]MDR5704499.1 META domain-containing protein [Agromyces sp. LY-1358]